MAFHSLQIMQVLNIEDVSSGKVKHELRVQIHELRVQIYELRVQIHELRVQIYELPVQIHELQD